MTDKELLELAAKAAGIVLLGWSDEWTGEDDESGFQTGDYSRWNPLTGDGDALRLAVRLGFDVCVNKLIKQVNVWFDEFNNCCEQFDSDEYAATRRAIVRVAAEIGKTMEVNQHA